MQWLNPLHIICTCTHTHTSPETRQEEIGYSEEYVAWCVEQAVKAVETAFMHLCTCDRVMIGCARVTGVGFNRRYWMRSGRVVTNPPRANTDIVRPEGPTDPDIPILLIEHDGRPAVLLASIVNHTDTLGTSDISSDWPGVVRRELEEKFDAPFFVMPLIGTSGNINHVDASRVGETYSEENPQCIGHAYATGIEAEISNLHPISFSPFGVTHRTFVVGPREIDPVELAQAKLDSLRFSLDKSGNLTSEDFAVGSPAALKYFADALLRVAEDRQEKQFEIVAIRLGIAAFISMPGEPFVEIGLKIRNELLPRQHVLMISHGNAAADYFPLPEHFEHGGYETMPVCCAHSTHSALRMIDTVREVVHDLGFENEDQHVGISQKI